MDERTRGRERDGMVPNWIYVSRTLAQLHGSERYAWNGIDPAEYIYSETKDDYFLFMSTMDWGTQKGLDVVLLSEQLGFKLPPWRAPARATNASLKFRRCAAKPERNTSAMCVEEKRPNCSPALKVSVSNQTRRSVWAGNGRSAHVRHARDL